jgi:hypothetical protein
MINEDMASLCALYLYVRGMAICQCEGKCSSISSQTKLNPYRRLGSGSPIDDGRVVRQGTPPRIVEASSRLSPSGAS